MLTEERLWGSARRGLALAAQLPEVGEAEAPASIRAIYGAVQQTLRAPYVDALWRLLANYPGYLERAWRDLEPNLGTHTAERAADLLRFAALLGLPFEPRDQRLSLHVAGLSDADIEDIRALNDTLHYVLPKVLLAAVGLSAALAGERVGSAGAHAAPMPRELAAGTVPLQPIALEQAPALPRRQLEEIARVQGYPKLPAYFLTLARWPDYLDILWRDLRPYVHSDWHAERVQELERRALGEWAALPHPLELGPEEARAAGCSVEQIGELRDLLASFRARLLPDLLLDLALAKALLDGPTAAVHSRFSLH